MRKEALRLMLEAGSLAPGGAKSQATRVACRPIGGVALSGASGTAGAAAARKAAQKILSGRDFTAHGAKTPRPFAGVLKQLGKWLHDVLGPVGHPFGSGFDWLARIFGRTGAEVIFCAVLVIIAFLVVRVVVRRSARLGREDRLAGTEVASDDPAVLEHQADDAEKNGDLELAVRLRFRAGLLRLERCGLLAERDTRTSREIAVILGSPSFTHLAADLEEILYAEVPAGASHADAARTLWPRVPEESVSR